MKPELIINYFLLILLLVLYSKNNFPDSLGLLLVIIHISRLASLLSNQKLARIFHQPRKLKITAKIFLIEDG